MKKLCSSPVKKSVFKTLLGIDKIKVSFPTKHNFLKL